MSSWLSAIHALNAVVEARSTEPLVRAALTRDEARFGADHPALCIRLVELGSALGRLGRPQEGETYVARAVRISERTNGIMHAATGQILLILAQLQAIGSSPGAADTAARAHETLLRTMGATHETTQHASRLATLLPPPARASVPPDALAAELDQGVNALRARDAEGSIDLLLPVADRARAAQNPALESYARGMLAQALFLAGRKNDALTEANRALEVATAAGHTDAARHFEALLDHMATTPDGSTKSIDDYNRTIREALDRAAAGDPDSAFREIAAVATAARQDGERGPEASARIVLGQIYAAREERDRAEVEFRRALELARTIGDEQVTHHVTRLLEKLGLVS